jgi:hypothetical protein
MSVKILMVDGVDRTDAVIFADAEFTSAVNGRAGTCHFRVKDANQTQFFTVGKEITLDVDGVRSWGGYAMQIKRGYWFDSYDCRCKVNLTPRYWEVEGADYNILFERRVLYDKVTPENGYLTSFPAGTADNTVIDYYIANHLDLSDDGLGTSLVTSVGTPSTDTEIQASAGWTWSTFMRWITSVTGAIYYIRPDKEVVHTDVETADAPFGISDDPTGGEIGCRDLEIDYDGSNLVNDALVWGAGQGSSSPVFSRATDTTSITAHGRWQLGAPFQAIWKQATADSVSNSYVYGSPQSLRGGKDDKRSAQCAVYTAGLVCGQKVPLRSAVFGFTEVIPIRSMKITFPTKEDVRWDLTLSHEINQPWTGFDFFPFPPFPAFPVLDLNIPGFPSYDPCTQCQCKETFTRTETTGWGIAECPSGTWTNPTSNYFSVNGQEAKIYRPAVPSGSQTIDLIQATNLPFDITFTARWEKDYGVQPNEVSGAFDYGRAIFGLETPAGVGGRPFDRIEFRLRWHPTTGLDYITFPLVGDGTGPSDGYQTGGSVVALMGRATARFKVRWRVETLAIRFKVWEATLDEPDAWSEEFSRDQIATSYPRLRVWITLAADGTSIGFVEGVRLFIEEYCVNGGFGYYGSCWSLPIEVTAKMRFHRVDTNDPLSCQFQISEAATFQGGNTFGSVYVNMQGGDANSDLYLDPQGRSGGTYFSSPSNTLAFTFGADVFFWVKLRIESLAVKAKAWKDGDTEPGFWLVSSTHASAAIDPTVLSYLLFHTDAASQTTGSYMELSEVTVTGYAETTLTDTFTRTETGAWGTTEMSLGSGWTNGPGGGIIEVDGSKARVESNETGGAGNAYVYLPCGLDPCDDPLTAPPTDAPVGYACANLARIPTPDGVDPSLTYYQTANVYQPGTTKVWVNGLRLAWYDYDELPSEGLVVMHTNVPVGGGDAFDPPATVYACYSGG